MGYLIGTDEAGYGPNLGPLVISATVWEAPDGIGGERLFEHVDPLIASRPAGRAAGNQSGDVARVVMADSKMLYTPERGLRLLERGLWAAFGLLGHSPRTWRDVWQTLAPEALDAMPLVPWYADYDTSVPFEHAPDAASLISRSSALAPCPLRDGLAAVGVRLVAVRSRAIFAHQFNKSLDRHGLKSTLLSHETLALTARLIDALPPGPVSVVCDKHGGRNRYAELLAAHFPDQFIAIHGESRERSVYRFGPEERCIEFCFRTKAESCLPAALASMASKYLRELAMRAFNAFWRGHIPDLRPTAGYPEDAKRFRVDIADVQRRFHIPDRVLWRMR